MLGDTILARFGSLRMRLTLTVVLLFGAGLLAGGALLLRAVEVTLIRLLEEQGRAEVHVVRQLDEDGTAIHVLHAGPTVRRDTTVRPDGTKVEKRWIGPTEPPGHDEELLASELASLAPHGEPPKIVATSPVDEVRRAKKALTRMLVVGTPLLIALLTFAAWIAVGRALRPVRSMTQHAARIAHATTPDRLTIPRTFDEVAELARTLNAMLDRLAESTLRQRQFVSDASHELRSPIAAMRTQIEVSLMHREHVKPPKVLQGVLAELERLEALVADLLALARLDEGHSLPHVEIDLDDLVLEEASRSRAVFVDTHRVTAVKVHGERKSLAHLVRNLLDNAATHAASRIVISTSLEGGVPVLRVDDDGPGIPEADRERIFERFTRLSSSRSRDSGGAGLGLSLVRRIAEQHGGVARALPSPEGGARFEVRFPRVETYSARPYR